MNKKITKKKNLDETRLEKVMIFYCAFLDNQKACLSK